MTQSRHWETLSFSRSAVFLEFGLTEIRRVGSTAYRPHPKTRSGYVFSADNNDVYFTGLFRKSTFVR